MNNVYVTWPKTRTLDSYLGVLSDAMDDGLEINFRVASEPKKLQAGNRCYMIHDGAVRGWLEVTGILWRDDVYNAGGNLLESGWYIVRNPKWHPIDPDDRLPGLPVLRRRTQCVITSSSGSFWPG